MKKYRLKKSIKQKIKQILEDVIVCLGAATLMVTVLSCLSWRFQQLDEKYIQEEYTKKTEMPNTQISQKNN